MLVSHEIEQIDINIYSQFANLFHLHQSNIIKTVSKLCLPSDFQQ